MDKPKVSVEKMRNSRNRAVVVYADFTNMKHKFHDSLFCCFEGDDAKYYFKRIEDKTGYLPTHIVPMHCEGKSEVIRLYNLIKEKSEYTDVKILYFVDRDFDESIKEIYQGMYETPVYSIENFYTTADSFIRILKTEFNYMETDPEYKFLIDSFEARQKDFHKQTTLFNAWLSCQRDKSKIEEAKRLNVSDFSLNKLVSTINLDEVISAYDLTLLEQLFPEAYIISGEELQNKIESFASENLQEIFRGKFELDFLYSFLEAIKVEQNTPKSRLKKKKGVQLNQSKKNMISEFSQYASTTECLKLYMKKFAIA